MSAIRSPRPSLALLGRVGRTRARQTTWRAGHSSPLAHRGDRVVRLGWSTRVELHAATGDIDRVGVPRSLREPATVAAPRRPDGAAVQEHRSVRIWPHVSIGVDPDYHDPGQMGHEPCGLARRPIPHTRSRYHCKKDTQGESWIYET